MKELKSTLWPGAADMIRKCHLSLISGTALNLNDWTDAFGVLLKAVYEEREQNPVFAAELCYLTEDTGFSYDINDILEEYFDELEEKEEWNQVVISCDKLLNSFVWKTTSPSQFYFRKGNALMNAGRFEEAEEFGKKWLSEYPNDLFGAASNAFLLVKLGREEEALALSKKYLGEEQAGEDSVYMAAVRLLELTKGSFAKERVAKKIAEFEAMALK